MGNDVISGWILMLLILVLKHGDTGVRSNEQVKRVCQNHVLHLDCPRGEQVIVRGAVFGRTQHITPECGKQSTSKCFGREGANLVAGYCAMQKSCEVSATTSRFGNPCPGIWKYLEVDYSCTKAEVVHSICDMEPLAYLVPGDHGYITSPNYPDVYKHDLSNCISQIIIPYGTDIEVSVFHTNFPDYNTCEDDLLTIVDQEMGDTVHLCEDSDWPMTKRFRNLTVDFKMTGDRNYDNDYAVIGKGFILEYRVTGCPLADLPVPLLAYLKGYEYGSWAEVLCEEGFKFKSGKSGRCECYMNQWNCHGPLVCEEILCDLDSFFIPNHTLAAVVDGGRQVRYTCEPGYTPVNGTLGRLYCNRGQWTGEIGQCQEMECNLTTLSVPVNMKVALSEDGKEAHFRCRYGYHPEGGRLNSAKCVLGRWTDDLGRCNPVNMSPSVSHKVAFSAYLSDDVIMVMSDVPIPYDIITLNDSNSFDTTKHVFEAPLDGVYSFSWGIHSVLGQTRVTMLRNGEIVDGSIVNGMILEDSGEEMLIEDRFIRGVVGQTTYGQKMLKLNLDDQVWMQLENIKSEQNGVVFVKTGTILPHVTFSGHLLYST